MVLTQVCCRSCAQRRTSHLWLTLADMRESDKHRFLYSPISQAGLFSEAVESFAQQFSTAQKQTEAFRHILPICSSGDGDRTTPCRRRRAGRRIFCFLFVLFRCWFPTQWYPKPKKKSSFLFLRVSRGQGWWCTRCSLDTPVPLSFRPVGSRARLMDAMPPPAPPAQPWSQVSVVPRTQTPLRDALPSGSGPVLHLSAPLRVCRWFP